jgi:Type II secretion system (T2SS), protein E, N-terminal domain
MPFLSRGVTQPRLDRRGVDLERRDRARSLPWSAEQGFVPASGIAPHGGWLETCSNRGCRTGWLHLWRSRSAPRVEGGWTCSPACTSERLQIIIARELSGRGPSFEKHHHRIPLGLLMLEQGWINAQQLRSALDGQRKNGAGRLGQWLVAREGVSEQLVTRALGLQWSCPVLALESHDPEALAPLLPRFFVDALGALPLRVAAGKLVYLGFEDRLDPVLTLALERISGLRVESGLVQGSLFQPAHTRMLQTPFPRVELLEAASEPALVRTLARRVEHFRPIESRLVRVHDCLWMRMWSRQQVGPLPEPSTIQDVICTIAGR